MTQSTTMQEPGWYQADSVGTDASPHSLGIEPAPHGARFVAFLIDLALGLGAFLLSLVPLWFGVWSLAAAMMFCTVSFWIYNGAVLQGRTGQSIGKRSQGIKIVMADFGVPPGVALVLVRIILTRLLATFFWIDDWWILVDQDNRRISDRITGLQVVVA